MPEPKKVLKTIENVKGFFAKTKAKLVDPKFVNDYKMKNIVLGLQSSKHPCEW